MREGGDAPAEDFLGFEELELSVEELKVFLGEEDGFLLVVGAVD